MLPLVSQQLVDVPPLPETEKQQIREVFNQPFSYLGRGKQMSAFESSDHRFVLKLFHPRPPLKMRYFRDFKKMRSLFSLKWITAAFLKKEERLLKLYQRYALAFREIRDETGLLYVHLTDVTKFTGSLVVEIEDRDGTRSLVEVNEIPFVLQKKGELAKTRLLRLMQQNDLGGLKAALAQLEALFWARAKKGITDRIQTLYNNYGFVDGKAIQIDVGRVWFDPTVAENPSCEVEKIMTRIHRKYKPA